MSDKHTQICWKNTLSEKHTKCWNPTNIIKYKIIGGQTNTHNVGNTHKTHNQIIREKCKKSIEKEIQEPTENVKDC